ncbi:glycosyltransferase [Hoeflea alexandrii]|uniref:glycosyltransferase n=1 Tax=Hoeflea alexandrii TaxID=288436 RepID=UPI0022AEAF1F|nr:glycosyltransferase [Hoeflea alexandrii]MCZ4290623.1 glycosyltransferase [Hoeflea alexandrii]
MKIVHITPHLGGGVGKAHAALCAADSEAAGRHYVLLEEPRDHRHLDDIRETGADVTIAPDRQTIGELMDSADIVQFEWWNHPLMCGLLAGPPLPAMRSVFWSHVSGIAAPFIPAGLVAAADRFVFTSACSRLAPNLSGPASYGLERTAVINSGFVHAGSGAGEGPDREKCGISYLGTVEFTKMSPAMMQVADRLEREGARVDVWGDVGAQSPVRDAVAAMKHPERLRLRGHTGDPRAALSRTSVFLYLLQPFHFGTAENALVEAMSLGCAPLVFANPCELEIVRDGETGLVATSVDHAIQLLNWMLEHPDEVRRMGETARAEVLEQKTPDRSIAAFRGLWQEAMHQPKRRPDFAGALGPTPRDWYEALQGGPQGENPSPQTGQAASKGSLAHFLACYPDLDLAPGTPETSNA